MPTDEKLYVEVHGPLGLKVLPRSLPASTAPGPESVVVTDDNGDVYLPGNLVIGGLLNGSPPGSGGTGTPIPNNTLVGNNTGATALPIALTAAQVKVLLGLVPADVAGLAPVATSGSATDLLTGTLDPNRIATNALALTKLATIPTGRLLGNNIGGIGPVLSLPSASVKTMLAITAADVSGLAPVATSGSASDLGTGTLPPARIGDASITLLKQAPLPAQTMVGNDTGAAGPQLALTPAQVKALLGISGSGFPAIAPNTLVGNNTGASVPPVALTAAQVKALLAITAADTTGFAPIATSGSASDLPVGTLPPARIGDGSVALTKLAAVAAQVLLGNATGAPAGPIGLTPAQVKTLLAIATGDISGLQAIASSGSATDLITGTLNPARIADGSLPIGKTAPIAASSLLGNNGGVAAVPMQLTAAQAKALLGISAADITNANVWAQAWLVTPNSLNLRNAMGDETGAGALVFSDGPLLNAPVIGPGSAAAGSWPKVQAGALLTTPEAGAQEYDGSLFYISPAAGKRALMPACYVRHITAAYALAAVTTPQSLFPSPANLALDVGVYEVHLRAFVDSMAAASGNALVNLVFTGSVLSPSMGYLGLDATAANSPSNAGGGWSASLNMSGNNAITATTGDGLYLDLMGLLNAGTPGSLSVTIALFTAGPGGRVRPGTLLKVTPLGPPGNLAIGAWS